MSRSSNPGFRVRGNERRLRAARLRSLYVANEGELVAIVASKSVDRVLAGIAPSRARPGRGHPRYRWFTTCSLGKYKNGHRIVDMLAGDQLPRVWRREGIDAQNG